MNCLDALLDQCVQIDDVSTPMLRDNYRAVVSSHSREGQQIRVKRTPDLQKHNRRQLLNYYVREQRYVCIKDHPKDLEK